MPDVIVMETVTVPIGPTGLRGAIAGLLMLAVLWWTVDRILGESDDPSASAGGDWLLLRASGLPLVALTSMVAALLLAPEIMASDTGIYVVLGLIGIVALWYGYKREERSA